MKANSQQVYDALFGLSAELGYDTYNELPPPGTAYPFVYIGQITQTQRFNKTHIYPGFTAVVDIWGLSRKEVSEVAQDLLVEYQFLEVNHLAMTLDLNATNHWIAPWEQENDQQLWRAQLSLVYKD